MPTFETASGAASDTLAGRSPRRQRRRERNKAELREAARESFRDKGYVDSTIAEITARADVAHGTFYNYYDTKDEVFTETVDELLEELFTVVHDLGDESSIRRRLTAGIGSLFRRCSADRGLVLALHQASQVDPAYSGKWAEFRDRLRSQVERDLTWLQERQLARDVNTEVMALIITRMIEGVALHIVTDAVADSEVDALTVGTVEVYWEAIFRPVAGDDDLIIGRGP